jgi:FdhE protein
MSSTHLEQSQPEQRHLETALHRIRQRGQLPEDLVTLLSNISTLQNTADAGPAIAPPAPERLAPADAVLQGRPLLDREAFPVNREHATNLFDQILALICREPGPLGEAGQGLRAQLQNGGLSVEQLLDHVLVDHDFFTQWGKDWPEAPRTAYFAAYNALLPGIRAAARALAPHLPEVHTWVNGSCPICGSLPLISILRGKEGFRHAVCSFCRHEYRVRRIACPICNADDQKQLTFFTVQEEPGLRVDVCKSCNHYIKTLDFRDLDREPVPEFDDLDSMALDFVARDQGFVRPTFSAWGF